MKKLLLMVLVAVCLTGPTLAQPKELSRFFPATAVTTGGPANLDYLVGGYVGPVAEDLGSLLNNAWYNTAENHKRFGFDLSVSLSTVFINSSSKYFNVDNSKLSGIGYLGTIPPAPGMPTSYGPATEVPSFTYNGGSNNGLIFDGPGGGNISKDMPIGSLAVPTIQGGIGLFANTDLRFRFTPAVTIGGTEVKNWGVGLMHDIKQHIAGMKELPFSLSLLLGYSNMTTTTTMAGNYETSPGSGSYDGQQSIGETTAFTAQVLISKSIPVLTFYAGVGYNSSSTSYSVMGDYYVDHTYISGGQLPLVTPLTLKDPFKRDFTSNGFRLTGGIRFKFGPLFLNGDYTLYGGQGLFTMGLGFTVR